MRYKAATHQAQSLPVVGEQNAMQILNQLYNHLQWLCDEPTGPLLNARLFRVSVTVEGQTYEGMANSKKTAKLAAANAALEGLRVSGLLQAREEQCEANRINRSEKKREVLQRLKESGQLNRGGGFGGPPRQGEYMSTDPVTRLSETHYGAVYKVIGQMGDYPDIVFTVQCIVNGVSYVGSGRNKRDSKYNAAEKAMRSLGVWTSEDTNNKYYRETHDGKNPPPKPRKHAPTEESGQNHKRFGFNNTGNQGNSGGSKWGGGRGGSSRGGFGGGRGGAARAGFNRIGGNDGKKGGFKSVLSSQWTQFKKGGTLGSGMHFEGGSGAVGGTGGMKKITGGTQSLKQQAQPPPPPPPAAAQSAQSQQDFTSDNYASYEAYNAQTPSYNYGYGTDTQTTQANAPDSYFTAPAYQNPAYGYGYQEYPQQY